MRFGSQMRPMQKLLEAEGDWNVGAHLVVDCTPLFRYHNPEDIHCGENVERLRQMSPLWEMVQAGVEMRQGKVKVKQNGQL